MNDGACGRLIRFFLNSSKFRFKIPKSESKLGQNWIRSKVSGMTDGGGRGKSFTPAHIQVRGEEAKFKREVLRIGKAQRQIEQKYKVSERKNTATQRGIIRLAVKRPHQSFNHSEEGLKMTFFCYFSLLGNDVYLDPGIVRLTNNSLKNRVNPNSTISCHSVFRNMRPCCMVKISLDSATDGMVILDDRVQSMNPKPVA